uniref:Uncharacterized protein n=1 Tax=Oryza sativa subsp. japonica TaxID=39947 RepID=Q852M5_ORYSJ|nr:hypothetical protein [Oryza sativa Japonica Group]
MVSSGGQRRGAATELRGGRRWVERRRAAGGAPAPGPGYRRCNFRVGHHVAPIHLAQMEQEPLLDPVPMASPARLTWAHRRTRWLPHVFSDGNDERTAAGGERSTPLTPPPRRHPRRDPGDEAGAARRRSPWPRATTTENLAAFGCVEQPPGHVADERRADDEPVEQRVVFRDATVVVVALHPPPAASLRRPPPLAILRGERGIERRGRGERG